ncbi:succinate dehydrogenase / fumarate reductase, cytochrome b subunit [Anaerolineales bacterium]|nr:succinate dehydrogenase / fumarate reductase, cytochrome b subunit [Anaerolineales bacterium]
MGLSRNVSLWTGLRYKGQGPYLTFILHRIGGLGMGIFVTMHILVSFFDGSIGTFLNDVYKHWAFQIFIFFCALFHAINGLRITLLDLFPKLIEHHREAMWIEWAIFLPTFGISALVIIMTALGG